MPNAPMILAAVWTSQITGRSHGWVGPVTTYSLTWASEDGQMLRLQRLGSSTWEYLRHVQVLTVWPLDSAAPFA